jgi:hypothetical protein
VHAGHPSGLKDYKSLLLLVRQMRRRPVKHGLSKLNIDLLTLCDRVWQREIRAWSAGVSR